MPTYCECVLSASGPDWALGQLRAELTGLDDHFDFSTHLLIGDAPRVDGGDVEYWYEFGAVGVRELPACAAGSIDIAMRTAEQPPIAWVNSLVHLPAYAEVEFTLLYGHEYGSWAGTRYWPLADFDDTASDGADVDVHVDRGATLGDIFEFVAERGFDFGWPPPGHDPRIRLLPRHRTSLAENRWTGPRRLEPGMLT
jgi:hypothetical protein